MFFFLLFIWKCRLFRVLLYHYIAVFSLYGEYAVRSFLPGGVFLPRDHGLDFNISLCENSIDQTFEGGNQLREFEAIEQRTIATRPRLRWCGVHLCLRRLYELLLLLLYLTIKAGVRCPPRAGFHSSCRELFSRDWACRTAAVLDKSDATVEQYWLYVILLYHRLYYSCEENCLTETPAKVSRKPFGDAQIT